MVNLDKGVVRLRYWHSLQRALQACHAVRLAALAA